MDEYYKVRWAMDAQAKQKNTKVIIVTDLSEFKPPPATIRKELAERAIATDASDAFYRYVTVVPSALLRGVLTAIQWIGGEQLRENTNVPTIDRAIALSLAEYEKLGIPPLRIQADSYKVPLPE
ncbi:hypothetical protein DB30_05651 [Enhygromyxa salina]|uniref:Uncharacterized protein n=1 Tax=Enhygromyxa salina TaxID=215803 RepID=A0A0C1ZWF3_9BACT|nr:hypothetical protein DB30_05651 [Enhygromyxa salina]